MSPDVLAPIQPERRPVIGVIGASRPSPEGYRAAVAVGTFIAQCGAVLVCGGLGGVMEGACRGCREAGGEALGILPGGDEREANPYVTLAVATNMGHARNVIIAHTACALIAVEGGYGTLSEIAVALKLGRPVISLGAWKELPGVVWRRDPEAAVKEALARGLAAERKRG
ncbi:MAG: TIGR00725 family protein [Deltaproteobacteria bacterium]|nr:TIGR00725 family protein [Deltaproteobacteria bacterium]